MARRERPSDGGGDDGGAFSLSQSLSPFNFFFSQKSVRLEDISGGGLFCLVFIWQGNDVVPLSFFFLITIFLF